MRLVKQSTARNLAILMVDSADHVTGKTGLTLTITASKNGGTFASITPTVTELATGWYNIALTTAHTDTLGDLCLHITATGADPSDVQMQVYANTFDTLATPTNITAGTIASVTNDVGITQAGADKVWGSAARTLTSFGTLVANTASAVWDELLTGATHNVATSAGKRLRTMDSNVILSDVLPSQAGMATNAIKFDGGASSNDGAYDPSMIVILDGAAAGQCRLIYQYDGTNKIAYVDRDWKVQPTAGATFAIIADPGREHVNEGLAQAGGTNTITLNALASSDDDAYLGQIVFLKGGTGADQASHVIAYNGTTKEATINKNWAVIPDNTTTYVMLPSGLLYLTGLVNDIWSNTTRTLTSGGGASAADVWAYGTRTLTQTSVAPQSSISAGNIIGTRGDTYSQAITGLGSLANYSAIYFTAKTDFGLPDAESTVQIVKKSAGTDGLLWLNASTTTAAWGSIIINDASAGNITINLTADAMKELSPNLYDYDIQIVRSVGTPVSTLAVGRWSVIEDVTRSVV